jgi:hypothetical protein
MKNRALSLGARFSLLTAALLAVALLMGDQFALRQTRTVMDMRLREKATFINNFYSFLIADALIRKDDITLLQVVDQLEKDQEITSVLVVDQKGLVRYNVDAEQIGSVVEDPLLKKVLETGEGSLSAYRNAGGQALALASPLKVQGQPKPLGALRIEFTYRYIDKQLARTHQNFLMVLIGALSFCLGVMLAYVRRWVSGPMEILKSGVRRINPALLESQLPETPDEFGEVNAAIHELLFKVKAEIQNQQASLWTQADRERMLIDQLMRLLSPGSRVLLADKDNRIISDSEGAADSTVHLLDLITDANFATLVAGAFQREGEALRGPAVFQEKPFEATVLRLPADLSKNVRTLIALTPRLEKETL